MRHLCLTDWVTLRGNTTSVVTITQGEAAWLDIGDAEDGVFYLDVREVTGTMNLSYQTSPSREEASFVTIPPAIALTSSATGTSGQLVLAKYSYVPLGRYVRWQLVGTTANAVYDVTFRIHLATV